MLRFEEDSEHNALIVTVDGFIEKENINFYLTHLKRVLEHSDKVRLVKIINKFEGIDFSSFMAVVWFYLTHLKRFEKCALITHNFLSGWQGVLGTFFAIVGYLISLPLVCSFRHFTFRKTYKAKEWINKEKKQDREKKA